MDYQQPHGYMRPPPPPPPAADPYQRPPHPPPHPPPPSNHPWTYSSPQFQYQPQTQHSPSPPPPQWPPPPDHAQYLPPPYHAHQPPPYPANPRYPPPHQFPPRPPHAPQSQDWVSGSWNHPQGWQYPKNNNEEDWAAKARAWLAAKAATDNQQGQSQFVPAGRPEEQNHFHDQYSQPVEPQPLDGHPPVAPPSNYQPYPMGHPSRAGPGHLQDSQYISSGQPSYAAGIHVPFAARDGSLAGDTVAPSQQQEKSSTTPLVHQQEVPSSYSSVSGKEEAGDRYEKFNSSGSLPSVSVSHHQPVPTAGGRSGWMEESHNLLHNQSTEPLTDLSDQPLNFAPHFNRDMDPHAHTIYTHSASGAGRGGDPPMPIPSNYTWTSSSVPGAAYPPLPPAIPTGPQGDHPMTIPSPASGHSAPMFPAGPGFQPTVPMIGPAFGVGAGVPPHPTTFSGDTYGVSDRPKKASVPNWLREEIIKNKAVITSSSMGLPKEDAQSIDEDNDKSYRKGDQADSKSIDSSRSTEDEDEDEVEAARNAAINKEIKRVLTEVLLKVTDQLFDEIATKVLKEDALSVEVGRDMDLSDNHVLPSTPISTPKTSAKVLIATKSKSDYDNGNEKSTSGSPGDILGLASYASDEEDAEVQSSSKLNSKENEQSSSTQLLGDNPKDGPQKEIESHGNAPSKLATDGIDGKSPISSNPIHSIADTELNNDRTGRNLAFSDIHPSSKGTFGIAEDELQHGSNISKLNKFSVERAVQDNERPDGTSSARSLMNNDSQIQNARSKSDKNDRLENKKRDHKDSDSSEERLEKKGVDAHRRHARTEKFDYPDNSSDKRKEKGRTDEKVRHTESRKRASPAGKDGTTDSQRDRRTIKNDYGDKRQNRTGDEKEERSKHKSGSESGRHRRHHSSDESSDDSKRKSRHSKRRKSPSPTRSRKRQVSRSPHSKHSKRRHSPYSSLETTRGRRSPSRSRSRSRSPAPRRR